MITFVNTAPLIIEIIDASTHHSYVPSSALQRLGRMRSPPSSITDSCSSLLGSSASPTRSLDFLPSELTTPPRTPPSLLEAAFICTICWQHQPSGSKPKLLGTSARIVCQACWRAVLDLSICWVCGECIVRGDDVVSLGWCFWHRGCFGCLMCRTLMPVPGSEDTSSTDEKADHLSRSRAEWGERSDGSSEYSQAISKTVGVELDKIPLCTVW